MEVSACVPVVDGPKCDKVIFSISISVFCSLLIGVQVELVLPKQICRELLYGYAEKPVHHYPSPAPAPGPQYDLPAPLHHLSKIKEYNNYHYHKTKSSNKSFILFQISLQFP